MDAELMADLETVMDVPPGSLTAGDALATLGAWDSLTVVKFLAMADGTHQRTIAPEQLRECVTVGDLLKLLAGPNA